MGFGAERSSDPLPRACARGSVACFIFVSSAVLLHLLCCMMILWVQCLYIKPTHRYEDKAAMSGLTKDS